MDPQLFGKVPPEVWTIILKYLDNCPNSLYHCYNALNRGSLHQVLFDDRTRFLLPLITENLQGYLSNKNKDLLNVRGVCKTWKYFLDNYLQDFQVQLQAPAITAYRNVHEPEEEWFKNKLGTTFNHPDQIDRFLLQMRTFEGNPLFPCKTVKLIQNSHWIGDSEHLKIRFCKGFTKLIKTFGDHISTLIYFADGSIECNREMKNLFKHLPNLRCLTIRKLHDWRSENDEAMESLDWLKDLYLTVPDSLDNLKSLNLFMDSNDLCESLLNWVSPRLGHLQIELDAIEHIPFFNELPIMKNGLINLQKLKLIGIYGDSCSLIDRLSVFNLPNLQNIYFNYTEIGRRASSLKYLLKLINKLSLTLTEIRFPFNLFNLNDIYPKYEEGEFEKDINLKLIKVKWIGVPYSYLGYDMFDQIMEKFPNLEELHFMDFDVNYQDKDVKMEELHQQTDNIWEKIESLKKLTVEEEKSNNIVFQVTRELYNFRKNIKRSISPLQFDY